MIKINLRFSDFSFPVVSSYFVLSGNGKMFANVSYSPILLILSLVVFPNIAYSAPLFLLLRHINFVLLSFTIKQYIM